MYADCNHGFSRTIPKNPQTEHVQKGTPADAPQRKDVSIMQQPQANLSSSIASPFHAFSGRPGGGFLSGLLLAGTYVGTMTSPLPIAIAANLSAPGAIAVLIGSLISYTLSNTRLDNPPLLFALVVVVCLRLLNGLQKQARRHGDAAPASVCFSPALPSPWYSTPAAQK